MCEGCVGHVQIVWKPCVGSPALTALTWSVGAESDAIQAVGVGQQWHVGAACHPLAGLIARRSPLVRRVTAHVVRKATVATMTEPPTPIKAGWTVALM